MEGEIKTKIFYGIDVFKLVCTILIVFMHTYCRDYGKAGAWFVDAICNIGVPFFFIASGFFFAKRLLLNEIRVGGKYLRKYLGRVTKMYIAWSVLTLPITFLIIERAHGDYPLYLKAVYLVRLFLFTGSIGIYWYVLALIYNSVIIYFSFKKKADHWLYVFAFLFWIIGTLYNSPYNNGNALFESIHVIFGSERNFLNVGLFYMSIGYFFAKHECKGNVWVLIFLFLMSIVARSLEVEYLHTNTLQALEAVLLFMIGINVRFNQLEKYSLSIRKLSTAIYLEHFPFILLFDWYLTKGTALDFNVTLVFSVLAYFILMRLLPDKAVKMLYGN